MFDKIYKAISKVSNLSHFSIIVDNLDSLIECFESEHMKDPNLKNDAIQAMCDYLQTLKTPPGNSNGQKN